MLYYEVAASSPPRESGGEVGGGRPPRARSAFVSQTLSGRDESWGSCLPQGSGTADRQPSAGLVAKLERCPDLRFGRCKEVDPFLYSSFSLV